MKIEDATENAWVSSTARSILPGGWWIGLSQDGSDWDWTDGSTAAYTNWRSGQPDDGSDIFVDEDCVEINAWSTDEWNDQRCHRDRPFVCEWP